MRRDVTLAGAMSLLLFALLVHPISAGKLWCAADPVVGLDQRLVDITIAIPVEYVLLVNGPTTIEIKTPPAVERAVVVNDLGFNGHGTAITFVNGGGAVKENVFSVEIRVHVPVDRSSLAADEEIPLQVTVTPDNQVPMTVTG